MHVRQVSAVLNTANKAKPEMGHCGMTAHGLKKPGQLTKEKVIMYQIKNWILNHKVAGGILLVLFTPLVSIAFGAIGLVLDAVFAALGFAFGMLNAAGVAVLLLVGLGYAGKRVWDYGNEVNEDLNESEQWLK